ncbi:DUF397 domain-containing protein [Kitasatospora mediocidica]|uniref:DUF397 domain-containing protein n=1 Tax=Kitasatospora mediocidica TaxID=58352 RepID=UPI00055B19D3|nr:DUF397 domain-containing protein [Kitasatospora mediocidica]
MRTTPDWIKSSYSNTNGGNCIEWAPQVTQATGIVPVRDSKDPDGPTLAFPATAFTAFVSAVKAGEFGAP